MQQRLLHNQLLLEDSLELRQRLRQNLRALGCLGSLRHKRSQPQLAPASLANPQPQQHNLPLEAVSSAHLPRHSP